MDGMLQGKLKVNVKHDGSRFIRQKLSYVRQMGPCHTGSQKNARRFLHGLLACRPLISAYTYHDLACKSAGAEVNVYSRHTNP